MKGRAIYLLLLFDFPSVPLVEECLTDDEANAIVPYWTSFAIEIDVKAVNETVTDKFCSSSTARISSKATGELFERKKFQAVLLSDKAMLILREPSPPNSMALQTACRPSRTKPT